MKVAAIQHNIVWADRQANFASLENRVRDAASQGAQFLVLSEMFSTGFVVDRNDIGEPVGGPSSAFLSAMAQELNVYIGGSCPEVTTDYPRPFNTFVVATPDGSEHRYSKIHPFTYGGEDKHFRAGQQHVTIDIDEIRTSLFVCYDLRFSDEFWSRAHDTDLYLVPANWPTARREHWLALLRARAIENQAYVVGCNRVGDGGGLNYSGDSLVIDPLGTVLAQGQSEACILYAEIERTFVSDVRTKYPFLQDRR